MNMTPILFAFLVILQKSNLLISHCRKVRRGRGLLDNLDAGVVVHAADTSVIMSNIKASELGLSTGQILGKRR
jgi:hypothetical protein